MKPSDQRPCQSYQAGHQMHWIHWKHCLRAVESRVRAHVREIREDGWFVLEMDDGAVASWWSHEPQRLRDLVAAGGEGVEVDADHHALVLDGQWFNCSARFDTACHTAGRQQAS